MHAVQGRMLAVTVQGRMLAVTKCAAVPEEWQECSGQ